MCVLTHKSESNYKYYIIIISINQDEIGEPNSIKIERRLIKSSKNEIYRKRGSGSNTLAIMNHLIGGIFESIMKEKLK